MESRGRKILVVKDLSVEYYRAKETIPALKRISCELDEGEILGLVGESGCGKSTLGLSLLGLIPKTEGKVTGGDVWFEEKNVYQMTDKELHVLRGKKISMIFQDPFTSFNPLFTIGNQIAETIDQHEGSKKLTDVFIKEKIISVLQEVQISCPERVAQSYPHQLSGGMLQRAMLAMAVVSSPRLLIADEPTTALDVTIQKEILELLLRLQKNLKLSIVLITHNMGIIRKIANRVSVMYAGRIVEEAPTREIFSRPLHPYTQALLNSIPPLHKKLNRLPTITGQIPQLGENKKCDFLPHCAAKTAVCFQQEPIWTVVGGNHKVRCGVKIN